MKNNQLKKYHVKNTLFIIIAGFSLVVSWFIFNRSFFKCKTILGSKICPSECKEFHPSEYDGLASEEELPPFEVCISDGNTKARIGSFKVSIPKGWVFSRTQYTDRLIVGMSPPNEDMVDGETNINIVYLTGTEAEKSKQPLKQLKKKNAVFNNSFNIGDFKGQSASYETEDNLDFYISKAVREKEVIQISSISPKGKMSEMKKIIYERVVYSP